ncbi:hypothetical protein P7C73_g6, partial [Tremellales sp. Uapishka_1]
MPSWFSSRKTRTEKTKKSKKSAPESSQSNHSSHPAWSDELVRSEIKEFERLAHTGLESADGAGETTDNSMINPDTISKLVYLKGILLDNKEADRFEQLPLVEKDTDRMEKICRIKDLTEDYYPRHQGIYGDKEMATTLCTDGLGAAMKLVLRRGDWNKYSEREKVVHQLYDRITAEDRKLLIDAKEVLRDRSTSLSIPHTDDNGEQDGRRAHGSVGWDPTREEEWYSQYPYSEEQPLLNSTDNDYA